MDFNFTPEEEAFRQELRAWLHSHLPAGYDPEHFDDIDADARFEYQRTWQKTAHQDRWVGIHWPEEYGGRNASLMEMFIFNQELHRVHAPRFANTLGLMMSGPTLIHWGTEEQKKRYLPRILSGDEIWCEGLSEPEAGSDLASMQTRARRGRRLFCGQRSESLDQLCPSGGFHPALCPHRPRRAQTPGDQLSGRGYENAGSHGSTAGPDDGRFRVQRSLF